MGFDLKLLCNFMFWYFQCTLPMDKINIEVTVRMVKGPHTFRKEHTSETTTCSPLSRQINPFPSLRKKIEAFEEEKQDKNFDPTLYSLQRSLPHQRDQGTAEGKAQNKKTGHGQICKS